MADTSKESEQRKPKTNWGAMIGGATLGSTIGYFGGRLAVSLFTNNATAIDHGGTFGSIVLANVGMNQADRWADRMEASRQPAGEAPSR